MSDGNRLVGAITKYSVVVVVAMLALTVVLGAGMLALEEESSLDQFETDPPEAEAYEDAQDRFGVEENETSAQIVVRDENVLSRGSLLETLELQQELRDDEAVNETLADDEPFSDLAGIVATVDAQRERGDELDERTEELEREAVRLEGRSETVVEWINETRDIQDEYEQNELLLAFGEIDEETYEAERERLEGEIEEIEERAQLLLTDDQYEEFEELLEETREVQSELFHVGAGFEFDGIDEEEFDERADELGGELEDVYAALEAEVFAEAAAVLEEDRAALEARSEQAVEWINETRDLTEEYEENELLFEFDQIDEETYEAERERLEAEFEEIDAQAEETLTDEEYDDFEELLEETREIQGELVRVGAQFEFGQIDEEEFDERTDELGAELEGVYERVETEVFAETAAELEARGEALEERSERAVELINETRDLQEAYEGNELALEFDEIDEETYEAERERLEAELEEIDAEAQEMLTDEEYAAFEELLEETREIQGELVRLGIRVQFDPVTEEEFDERTEELGEELEGVYEGVEDEIFAEEIDELEAAFEDLEEEADEIPELELTLDEQIERVEGMDQDDVEDVLEELLDEDAEREVFVFLPAEFEPGSTEADSRMLFVTQTADEPQTTAGETTEEIVDAQLAMSEYVDDRFGEDGFVFGTGILTDEIDRSLFDSLGVVLPFALVFVAVVLTIAYRDLLDILLGLSGIVIVLVWTFGFMGWVGIDVSQVIIAVPVLIIGLSIDYSIHVFMRHREQREVQRTSARRAGSDATREQRERAGRNSERVPRGAMGIVLLGLGVAFVWVTTTAAIGFLSNLVSPVGPIQEFGVASAFGIVSAFAVFGALVPAAKVELDEVLEARGIDRQKSAFGTGGGRLSGVLSLGQRAAVRVPWLVVVAVLLLTAGGAAGAAQLDTTFDEEEFVAEDPPDWMGELPEPFAVGEYETSESLSFVNEHFLRPDIRTHVVVDGEVTRDDVLERVDEIDTLAAEQETTIILPNGEPHVTSPLTEMEAVAAENETFNETFTDADTTGDEIPDTDLEAVYDDFFEADEDRAVGVLDRTGEGEYEGLQILVSVDGDADAADVTSDGRVLAEAIEDEDLEATATGQVVVFNVIEDDLFEAVFDSLLVSLVAVFLVLMVAYRWRYGSALLGAVTLFPIILSVSWILGTMYLLGIPFNVMTGTITSLTIGLGVAYNIHMTERYMLERVRGQGLRDALYRSVTGTGGALFGSAATTVGGFGVLAFAILPPLQQFGLITALTIAYAFVGSVFVLPSFLVLWTRHLAPFGHGEWGRATAGVPAVEDED